MFVSNNSRTLKILSIYLYFKQSDAKIDYFVL